MCAVAWTQAGDQIKFKLQKRTNPSGASSFNPCGKQLSKLSECQSRHEQLFEGLALNTPNDAKLTQSMNLAHLRSFFFFFHLNRPSNKVML